MKTAVVEVGPQTVRGPESVAQERSSVAIECIDDRFALLEGRLAEVRQLWSDLLEAAAGECRQTLKLVFPTWWSPARIELVTDAARGVAPEVHALQRAAVLSAQGAATVAELSEEFCVIAAPDAEAKVLLRGDPEVAGLLTTATEALIDVPAGVSPLTPALTARLRAVGIPVAWSDREAMVRAVCADLARRQSSVRPAGRPHSRRRTAAVLAGAMMSLAAIGVGWAAQMFGGPRTADTSTVLLVEGRVAVRVPAQWTVEHITAGPGSARLRVSARAGEPAALHVTQSAGEASTTIAEVAETLKRALKSERPGVFRDLDPNGSVGGRPAVTYRELRAASETAWAVVVDGATRVAIGCQSPPGHPEAIRDACVRAVQTAHVLR